MPFNKAERRFGPLEDATEAPPAAPVAGRSEPADADPPHPAEPDAAYDAPTDPEPLDPARVDQEPLPMPVTVDAPASNAPVAVQSVRADAQPSGPRRALSGALRHADRLRAHAVVAVVMLAIGLLVPIVEGTDRPLTAVPASVTREIGSTDPSREASPTLSAPRLSTTPSGPATASPSPTATPEPIVAAPAPATPRPVVPAAATPVPQQIAPAPAPVVAVVVTPTPTPTPTVSPTPSPTPTASPEPTVDPCLETGLEPLPSVCASLEPLPPA